MPIILEVQKMTSNIETISTDSYTCMVTLTLNGEVEDTTSPSKQSPACVVFHSKVIIESTHSLAHINPNPIFWIKLHTYNTNSIPIHTPTKTTYSHKETQTKTHTYEHTHKYKHTCLIAYSKININNISLECCRLNKTSSQLRKLLVLVSLPIYGTSRLPPICYSWARL